VECQLTSRLFCLCAAFAERLRGLAEGVDPSTRRIGTQVREIGGPCRSRTYDQEIKSLRVVKSADTAAETDPPAHALGNAVTLFPSAYPKPAARAGARRSKPGVPTAPEGR
jgi:hypothetical protein